MSPMNSRDDILAKWLITLVVALLCVTTVWAGQWTVLGPDGGDVRSLSLRSAESRSHLPGHQHGTSVLLQRWRPQLVALCPPGAATTMCSTTSPSIRRIPTHMYVSAWSVENQQAGDVFRSQ